VTTHTKRIAAILGLLTNAAFSQTLSLSLDRLDASDPGGPPPANLLVIDVYANFPITDNPDYVWAAGGMHIETAGGATLVYARDDDPNFGAAGRIMRPGLEHRLTTFISRPISGRNSGTRFNDDDSRAVGGLCPEDNSVEATDALLDTIWIQSPLIGWEWYFPGYVARVALDLSATGFSADELQIVYERPANFLLACECPDGPYPGLAGGTVTEPIVGFDWWVTVPEPASIALLLGGATLVCRRRE
jgi:hypothetical protein